MWTRRLLVAAGTAAVALPAFADTRFAVPGGGTVLIPSPYDRAPGYPTYADRVADSVLVRYRKWRSTISGHPECDGMIAVGLAARFASLDAFVRAARGALSIQWSDADRIPGQAWTGDEERYPVDVSSGGDELVQELAVHRPGLFTVSDQRAQLLGRRDASGLCVAVWIFDKHGGLERARRIATRITSSYSP